jgi:hypothetical protein
MIVILISSNRNPLDDIPRYLFLPSIIKPSRSQLGMPGLMESPTVCGAGARSFIKSSLARKTHPHNDSVPSPCPLMASR